MVLTKEKYTYLQNEIANRILDNTLDNTCGNQIWINDNTTLCSLLNRRALAYTLAENIMSQAGIKVEKKTNDHGYGGTSNV